MPTLPDVSRKTLVAEALASKMLKSPAADRMPVPITQRRDKFLKSATAAAFPVDSTLACAVELFTRCSCTAGLAVPTPTAPVADMSIELVGAPGRMRKGRREPPVTSRTKKFASLPATSHVCAVNPPELFCSYRWAVAGNEANFFVRDVTG